MFFLFCGCNSLVEWDAFQPRRQFILREITTSVEQVVLKQLQDNGELGFWITNAMLLEHLAKRYACFLTLQT